MDLRLQRTFSTILEQRSRPQAMLLFAFCIGILHIARL